MLLLAAALLWVTSLLFAATDPDGFARELVSAAVGAIATLVIAGVVALIALRSRVRAYLEKEQVRRFDQGTWATSSIRAGQLDIPQMSIVASCTQATPWTDRMTVEFKDAAERELHPLVEQVRDLWLPDLLKRARTDYVLTDAARIDLVAAELRIEEEHGRRRPHYTFHVAPSRYVDFACTNARLDVPLTLRGESEPRTLRQRWEIAPRSILDLGDLPTAAPIGSGTVAVTSDNRMILGVRSRTFIAGGGAGRERRRVHFVAEGILPEDRDDDGHLSPLAGARRGLREELHVGPRSDHVARVNSLVATGLCFDQLRWQPYFTFVALLDRTWDEVHTAAAVAADAWEVESLVSLPFDIEHAGVRSLLLGRHPDLELASNHAAAALWFALLYQHGYQQMRDELSRDRPSG